MARFSAVVCAPLLVTVALAACSGEGTDYPLGPGGAIDAGLTGDDAGDAMAGATPDAAPDATTDARGAVPDAAVDAAPSGVDLSIAITGSPDPVAASSTLTYRLDVTNRGVLDAVNVVVTQRLPPGDIQFLSASGIDWRCAAAGQVVTCARDTLLVGAAPSIAVKVTTPPSGGPIATSARVTSGSADPDPVNNDASATTVVLTPADLAIAITDAPDPVAAGGTLTYTITVTNAGPGTATGITVLDSVPSGVAIASASGTGWSCAVVGHSVTCFAATLDAAAASTIAVVATAPISGGAVTSTASVAAATPDGNPANNQATTSASVNAAADLAIAVSSPAAVPAAAQLTYTIDVTNRGPRDASDVVVTGRLPDGDVLFLGATGIGWACTVASQVVTCTRASLLAGEAPLIAVQIRTPAASGALTCGVTVSASTTDLDLSNNTASVTTGVFDSADLSIAAGEGPDPVQIGAELTYTLSVANDGPTAATAVRVVDTLPPGTTFVEAIAGPWSCGNVDRVVTCTLPSLASASSAPAIAIVATAPATAGQITNTATVASDTSDPDGTNDAATTVALANAFADLSVTVVDDLDPIQGTTDKGCGSNACVTYTISVTNAGPDPATGVQVVTELPPNGSFISVIGSGWVCPAPVTTAICTRTRLDEGPAPPIVLVWKAPSPGGFSIVVNSTVSGTSTDPDPTDNIATEDTTVLP